MALALIFGVALLVRLWGIDHGLPSVYNPDEAAHFVTRAVAMHRTGDLNPGYFVNPPLVTYIFYLALGAWFGGSGGVSPRSSPIPDRSSSWRRVTVAVIGAATTIVVYLTGSRLFDRTVGLVSALLLAVAFLPVSHAHHATNDVLAMAMAAVALLGVAGVIRRGRLGDYALAGVGLGLACAAKYTAGIVLLPLLIAGVHRWRRHQPNAIRGMALAAAASIAAFVVVIPYLIFDNALVLEELGLLSVDGDTIPKIGQAQANGFLYYPWVISWGLGWVPAAAAVVGAVVLAMRDRLLAWVLVLAPILYMVFMAMQGRWFGRWLLPVFPMVVVLAAFGGVVVARAVAGRLGRPSAAFLVGAAVLLCVQSAVHVVHMDRAMGRTDTRTSASEWIRAKCARWVTDPEHRHHALSGHR